MAQSYTVIGSRFRPYSLDEYIKPLNMYKEEYEKQQEQYNAYNDAAGLIGSNLDESLDSEILNTIYNPYVRDLETAAQILSSEGLTLDSKKSLQNLRRRFSKEISPIKTAVDSRIEARKKWDNLSAQDKTLMTNANPYYLGIDSYMGGKSPETYYVSGTELYGRGKALAEAFSKTLRSVPHSEGIAANLENQYFRIIKQFGPNSKEMSDFMNDVAGSIPELRSQISDILENSNIYKEGFTQSDINRATQYIIEGMKAGLSGNTDVQYLKKEIPKIKDTKDFIESPVLPTTTTTGINQLLSNRKKKKLTKEVEDADNLVDIDYNDEVISVPAELKSKWEIVKDPKKYEQYKKDYDSKTYTRESPWWVNTRFGDRFSFIDNNREPFIDRDSVIKEIEKFNANMSEKAEQYSYISDNPTLNYQLGLNKENAESSVPIRWYNFEGDDTLRNKVISSIDSGFTLFKNYDPETQTDTGKYTLNMDSENLDETKIKKVTRDGNGKIIVQLNNGKYYHYLGSDLDQQSESHFNALIKASNSFEEGDVQSGDYVIPGIGNYKDRPSIDLSGVDLRDKIKTVEALPDEAVPIISRGKIAGYKLAITDSSTGIPYNIIYSLPDTNGNSIIYNVVSMKDYISGNEQTYDFGADLAYSANLSKTAQSAIKTIGK